MGLVGAGVGHDGGEEPVVDPCQDQRGAQPEAGGFVAEGVGGAFDEAVEAEASQVVGHLSRGHCVWVQAQCGGEEFSQVAAGEAVGVGAEHDQGDEQRLGNGMVETQGRHALAVDGDGLAHLVVGVGPGDGVAAGSFDVEETPVGFVADPGQGWQVVQSAADTEIAGVVDCCFCSDAM